MFSSSEIIMMKILMFFFKNFAMLLLIKTRQFSVRYTMYQTIREKLAFISR